MTRRADQKQLRGGNTVEGHCVVTKRKSPVGAKSGRRQEAEDCPGTAISLRGKLREEAVEKRVEGVGKQEQLRQGVP